MPPRHSGILVVLLLASGPLIAQESPNPALLGPLPDESGTPVRGAGSAGLVASLRGSLVHVLVEADGGVPFVRESSGVIVSSEGLVLTWRRLVKEAEGATDKQIHVQLNDENDTRLPAGIEAIDASTGLALLRVKPAAPLVAATVADRVASVGEPMLVIARPYGKETFSFAGVASASAAGLDIGGVKLQKGQFSLSDSRNDSRCDGAPVFDHEGRLLGLYSSERVRPDLAESTAEERAIPSFGVILPGAAVRKAFGSRLGAPPAPPGKPHPWSVAVAKAAESVVTVWGGSGEFPVAASEDPVGSIPKDGHCSGVVISARGLVVCSLQGVQGTKVKVRTITGTVHDAKVLAKHPASHLALLQVELPAAAGLVPISCNGSEDPLVGEDVLAIGSLYGEVAVSKGVVSAIRGRHEGRIQCDANLGNPNEGGAVTDAQGRLLGIGVALPGDAEVLDEEGSGRRDFNLGSFVSMRMLRSAFREHMEQHAGSTESIVSGASADRRSLETPLSRMVQQHAGAFLNLYLMQSVTKVDEDDPFASMRERQFRGIGYGSGVVIDPSGLALSNWHVVNLATEFDGSMVADHAVEARVFGGKKYRVKVLSISYEDDLALLQLELAPGEKMQAVQIGDSDALSLGEQVAAIGNPHGLANTVTLGLVSAKGQAVEVRRRRDKLHPVIETDAAINPGNSGGPLLDMNGRLVGINSAGGGRKNRMGFAIEANHARKQALGLLLQPYKLRSPDLGIRLCDQDGKVLVLDCDPRGPGQRAGLKQGDRILSLDGVAILWSPAFALRLMNVMPGQELAIEVERDGVKQAIRAAPVSSAAWAVLRMSGLQVRDFSYAEDEDRMLQWSTALFRATTGNATGEPSKVQESAVLVERSHPGEMTAESEIQDGDVVLAVDVVSQDGVPSLHFVDGVQSLRKIWNTRQERSFDGISWSVWVGRGAEVKRVKAMARTLKW